ncbi:NnrS family protein, partial [Bdellovibrionales bacterium]|nr:NnrS family protein [Bdellovibrionales bacterium]
LFVWRLVVTLWPYLFPKEKRRNQIFAYLLIALGLSQVGFLLGLQWPSGWWSSIRMDHLALGVITMVVVLISERIIPMFTANALGCLIQRRPRVQMASLVLTGVSFSLLSYLGAESTLVGGLFLLLGGSLGVSYSGWGGRASLATPLVWSLHLGFIWIILAAFYLGLSPFLELPYYLALHMLTFGGISGVIYAMVSRVSLGHTGNPLKASRSIVIGYLALHIGVVCRTILPILDAQHYLNWLSVSGSLWAIAFALLFVDNARRLLGPRAD